jgi:hypothetical protein
MTPTPTDVQTILSMYLQMPDTPSRHRPADRRLAIELHQRQVPIEVIESALLLTTVRRLCRHARARHNLHGIPRPHLIASKVKMSAPLNVLNK